jgi:hypothetical protein
MPFPSRRGLLGPAQVHATAASISTARIVGMLCIVLTAGCAGIERSPRAAVPPVGPPSDAVVSVEPMGHPPAPAPELPQAVTAERGTVAPEATVAPAAQIASGAARPAATQPATSTARAPARPAALTPAAAQLAQAQTPAPALAKPPAPPPLDLKSLETRLKETKAIGVFTKLTLKNQVDDLLSQFRDYYQGRLKATLTDLRASYDMLVLKVLALLQDADPPLAVAIASSRESIWGILSNRARFAAT